MEEKYVKDITILHPPINVEPTGHGFYIVQIVVR